MGTITDWLTLVAILIGAGAIAWLAWETRRSVQVAAAATRTATSALELARAEQDYSRQLVAESIKTRIDAQAPRITVVPHELLRVVSEIELPVRFPRDDAKPVYVAVAFSVHNDSGTTVVLHRRAVPGVGAGGSDHEATIVKPGQRTLITAQVARPLAEWRAIADRPTDEEDAAEFRRRHGIEPDTRIVFGCATAADDGAVDEYAFRLVGSPLRPEPGEGGGYHCFPPDQTVDDRLRLVADPRRRTYYLSRSRGIELPTLGPA